MSVKWKNSKWTSNLESFLKSTQFEIKFTQMDVYLTLAIPVSSVIPR